MATWRSAWQTFKKQYPEFEKSKNFKSDVGPQMDKYESAVGSLMSALKEIEKKFDEAQKLGKSAAAAINGYGAIAKGLEKTNKGIYGDFQKLLSAANRINGEPREGLESLARQTKRWELNFYD